MSHHTMPLQLAQRLMDTFAGISLPLGNGGIKRVVKFPPPPDKIAVVCVAKTGGTSLSNLLHEVFGSTQCLREIQALGHDVLGHVYLEEINDYLVKISSTHRLVVGHIPIGITSIPPGSKIHYFTILREPISRMVSNYLYIYQDALRDEREHLNAMLHRKISSGRSVVYSNPVTRLMAGREALVPRIAETGERVADVSEDDAQLAVRNLEKFAFVGLTERLQDSTRILFAKLGCSLDRDVPKDNITKRKLARRDLHPDTVMLLESVVEYDQWLYAAAVSSFNKHASAAGLPLFDHKMRPRRKDGPISSGDQSHLVSAASAMSSRPEGVWVSQFNSSEDDCWIGWRFERKFCCQQLQIQLPPNDGVPSEFCLEASHDNFQTIAFRSPSFTVVATGDMCSVDVRSALPARFWRVRLVAQGTDGPAAIMYVSFGGNKPNKPRNIEAVRKQMVLSRSVL